jgi:hypothetical protein
VSAETVQEAAPWYLTGVQSGWHAVGRDALQCAAVMSNGVRVAQAECGALVRVSKHGPYRRDGYPVMHDPCPECAWTVAIATGTIDGEISRMHDPDEATALARLGFDPMLPGKLCAAIIAAAENPVDVNNQAVIRQLATVTRHRPGLAVSEGCAEGDCEDIGADGKCDCPASAVCWTCSLRSGDEAGEWAGTLMEECRITAPCGVFAAFAAHYESVVIAS